MSTPIRIASVDELPPGHGCVAIVGGVEVAVYNVEGRYFASAARPSHVGADQPPGHAAPCFSGARTFEVSASDSPALLREGDPRYAVRVRGADVLLYVDGPLGD